MQFAHQRYPNPKGSADYITVKSKKLNRLKIEIKAESHFESHPLEQG